MGKKRRKKTEKGNDNEESVGTSLRANLEEIKAHDGVIGYILRNTTSAAIDLNDPTKIIDYAILSSSAFDTSEVLSKEFELGDVESIIVEGKDADMLSLTVDENKTSIFVEKGTDHKKVMRKIK